ncbi:hypothetical protein GWO43_24865 [candidate division KSB1 bacterium]|nr:hypothetical protein [candidate division KSB1 bacterium]NIT74047.1 hypothetical protein [candidate division KSB1 bacterium]NIX73727.1 hypothetical protein [candidate division KSB1 bacterium]
MFDPVESEFDNEFVEIVNLSDSATDISGWQISDGAGVDEILEVNGGRLILDPGQIGIILDPSYFDNSDLYDDLIPETSLILTLDNRTFGSRGLSNSTPETVSLLNAEEEIVSEYTFSIDNEMGFSDEKIELSGPNTPNNWANSKTLLGSPGQPNTVAPLEFDLAVFSGDLKFTPEQVQAGEIITITGTIRNLGKESATDFVALVFDDLDGDSLGEVGEEVAPAFEFTGSLASGDSTTFSIDYQSSSPGQHLLILRIDFSLDQDTTNNVGRKSVLIAFPQRTAVINEIMYSPLPDQAEWIEIFNLSSRSIDLYHWRISDSDTHDQAFIDEHIQVSTDSYHVFVQDSSVLAVFSPPAGTFTVLKNWPSLNNQSDSVVLYDLTGSQIDRVDYNNNWGGDTGISLEKINPELASNDSSSWSSSVVFEGGSPGAQNSVFTDILPSETTLNIAPNPFSPDSDGEDDFAVINFDLPLNTAVVNVKIYDLRGRLIRFLANNRAAGSQNRIIWDGKDNSGQLARMGIYIVFLQALNAQAGVTTTAKKTVVLAGKL